VGMILLEAVALGAIGIVVGSIIGSIIVVITSHTGIDYAVLSGIDAEDVTFQGISFSYVIYPKFEFRHIVFGAVAVGLTSIIASAWPASLAARLQPAEAVRS